MISRQSFGSTATSHVSTPSMVAMLGWIIPLPFEQPPMVISVPPANPPGRVRSSAGALDRSGRP